MNEKPWWQSKTIIGAVVTLGGAIGLGLSESEVTEATTAAVTLIGFLMTVYGRIVAKKALK